MRAMRDTTQRRLVLGDSGLADAPGEAHVVRNELTADGSGAGEVLLRLLHLTDLHVMDAASPARAEWVQARAHDPQWQPLLDMHRPYEVVSNHGVAAMVDSVQRWDGAPIELALSTGDCIDNAQANELSAYLALLDGGTFALPYAGPLQHEWRDHLRADDMWTYWCPEDGEPDVWKTEHSFPIVPDLLSASGRSVVSAGLPLPWFGVLGNHDVMRQGTVWSNDALEAIALGTLKTFGPGRGVGREPVREYLDTPESFSAGAVSFTIAADRERRAITADEFVEAHRTRGRGFEDGEGDYVHVSANGVVIVVLDTNHPGGNFQGSIGTQQLDWLDTQLVAAGDSPVVVASHHGAIAMDNTQREARRLGPDLEAALHRRGNVVAWLTGHRHVHRIRPCPDPSGRNRGFWDITTSSIIDWPCQGRIVEIVRSPGGSVGVRTTVVDHDTVNWRDRGPHWMGALHRELASRVAATGRRARAVGQPGDRNAILSR